MELREVSLVSADKKCRVSPVSFRCRFDASDGSRTRAGSRFWRKAVRCTRSTILMTIRMRLASVIVGQRGIIETGGDR